MGYFRLAYCSSGLWFLLDKTQKSIPESTKDQLSLVAKTFRKIFVNIFLNAMILGKFYNGAKVSLFGRVFTLVAGLVFLAALVTAIVLDILLLIPRTAANAYIYCREKGRELA